MKKSAGKQMITIAGGVLACSMQMMGCYPLAPAYFAAAFLEEISGVWLTAAMYIGMLYFMPLTATVKYAVALLVTAGAIKLVEWANEGCPAVLAAVLTAITTMILSFCGGLLEWKDQPEVLAVFLEGIFVFGAVILLNRVIHTKTRPSQNTAQNVSADVLLKKSLRFDPQIIVPAEMRGEEAMTAQEAGRTGHTIITSLHASTALAAYTRILTMCMMSGTKLSEELMLKLIIEAYPIMAFKMQLPDKSRKYMKIIEAEDYRDGEIIYRTLYKYVITDRIMNKDGTQIDKMVGYHKKVSNISSRLANILLENGADLQTIHRFAGENWSPEADTEG